MSRITVLLADDHTIVRQGFRKLVELDHHLSVVGEATDGHIAVEMAVKLRPDVVIMDIAMPHLSGLAATRQLLKVQPAARILMLSAHGDESYIKGAMEAGAKGYLIKQASIEDVSQAIHSVHQGKPFFSIHVPGGTVEANARPSARLRIQGAEKFQLTSREMEILQLVAEGMANKSMAIELDIAIKTVEKHREHLMRKLGIHDTAGLTRYAISSGIIESSVQDTTTCCTVVNEPTSHRLDQR